MRTLSIAAAMLALAAPATAQLVSGGVGGVVNGAIGGVNATTRATADGTSPNSVPDAASAVDRTARHADATTTSTLSQADRPKVRVAAGASVRVEQGTRCYYDDYYYDPIYRDGGWYCERTGSGAAVSAGARAGRP